MLELLATGQGIEQWSPTGDVSWMDLGGHDMMVAIRRDEAEIRRRREHGLGAVLNRRALHLLASMPAGAAVPVGLFRSSDRRLLRSLPGSVLRWHGSDVTALLRPAVSLLSVGAVASTWQRGVRQTSPFASYCSRYVVLDGYRGRPETSWVQTQARFYGVGLALRHDEGLDWQVAPASFLADRFTAATWLMAERVTDALGL